MKIKGLDKETAYRLKKKIRLTATDETRMRQLVNLRVSWVSFIGFLAGVIIVLGLLGVLLIVSTPLKALLPGYLYTYEREDVMSTTRKIDSISAEVAIRNAYVDNLMAILENEVDTVLPQLNDSVPASIPIDSIIQASEAEREFLKRYETNQKFNLSVLTPLAAQGLTFINPLQGAEARVAEEGEDERHITFFLPRLQPVTAIYKGTVLDVYNTMDSGFTVIVQHPNDFISRYSGLTDVMVRRGQTVSAGTRLGLIERERTEAGGFQPAFELWYNGSAVNPREYIPF